MKKLKTPSIKFDVFERPRTGGQVALKGKVH
jgi:hypothetical protein